MLLTKTQRRNKQWLNAIPVSQRAINTGRKLLSKALMQQVVEMNQEVVPLLQGEKDSGTDWPSKEMGLRSIEWEQPPWIKWPFPVQPSAISEPI